MSTILPQHVNDRALRGVTFGRAHYTYMGTTTTRKQIPRVCCVKAQYVVLSKARKETRPTSRWANDFWTRLPVTTADASPALDEAFKQAREVRGENVASLVPQMVKKADADILRVSRDIDHLDKNTTCQDYANAEVKLRTRRRLTHRPRIRRLLTADCEHKTSTTPSKISGIPAAVRTRSLPRETNR